jgi:ZIP family zinc transporter
MENSYIYAFILTLVAGLATGLGGVMIMVVKKFSPKVLSAALGFSAGVMILISFVEMFPEARESLSGQYGEKMGLFYALVTFFCGMGFIALIDYLVPSEENPHEVNDLTVEVHNKAVGIFNEEKGSTGDNVKSNRKLLRVGLFSAIVIAIHNFPEGLATFVSAMDNITLGVSIAFAIALHNIPEGIAIAIPIYYATGSKVKAIRSATLSGLAEPIGGLVGFALLSQLFHESVMGFVLAAVAGIMVYISLDELLPTAENYGEHHVAIGGVVAGMAFIGFGLLIF